MKRKNFVRKGIIFSLVCTFLVTSCYKIDDLNDAFGGDVMLPPELMLPVGVLDMSIIRILDRIDLPDEFRPRPNGNEEENLISVFYSIADTVNFNIPDLELDRFSPLRRALPPFDIDWVLDERTFPLEFEIDMADNELVSYIESIVLNSFDVQLTVTAPPGVDLSGVTFRTKLHENARQMCSNNREEIGSVQPSEAKLGVAGGVFPINFNNVSIRPTADNKLPFTVEVEIGENIAIPAGATITYVYEIVAFDWAIAYGSFPPARRIGEHSETHEFDISSFDGFRFYDPRITVNIKSNVGTTFEFQIDFIEAYHSDNPTDIARAIFNNANTGWVDSYSTTAPINKRPRYPWSEPISMNMTETPFDRHNGSTNLLFNRPVTPNRIRYEYSVTYTNVEGDYRDAQPFITRDAQLAITVLAELPLWLDVRPPGENRGFNLTDTINVDLTGLPENSVRIEEAKLVLRINNGLPVDIDFSVVKFLDRTGNEVIISDNFIEQFAIDLKARYMNPNGTVKHDAARNADPITLEIELDEEQYNNLRQVTHIVFHLDADLEDGDKHIRVTPEDFFRIRAGISLRGDLDSGMFDSNNN